MESVIAVLMNLLKTLDRPGGKMELPKRLKNTAFLVTSGPGREKNSAKINTKWNSWNTLSPTEVAFDFLESVNFLSMKMNSAMISRQWSWLFLLVQRLSIRFDNEVGIDL